MAASNGNDTHLLVQQLDKARQKEPGLVGDFGLNNDGLVHYVFVQTSEMRDTSDKFSEHVCVDCTYCVNDG